jgi:1-phosphatidylinositol-4-phosphate 5-kinase
MEILKCGSDANKARISFKMIAKKEEGGRGQRNRISQGDFMEFLNDFFNSWSSITNISITP